ncbi:MAG TPA: transcription antitermination factor NusB [Xanthobacteraceae bacterium]|nr:transcription antitermination factor NusB [Xanthobacteraceae bacterium]
MNSPEPSPDPQGLAARRIAAEILEGVLRRGRSLDDQLDGGGAHAGLASLPDRDRALARRLIATVLRRLGTLRHLLGLYLERGLPKDSHRVETALLTGAAQILWLDVPDHAAVDLSVRLVQADRRDAGYAGLVNAVLRKVANGGAQQLLNKDTVALDTPEWLMARWQRAYGAELAYAIAAANGQEPALDISVKSDPAHWADALGGQVLPTGSVRAVVHGPVPRLAGYDEGAWWVQDAAAALPAQLLGDVRGKSVADLCAAPGGKTAQLAAAGARVTAVDRSASRLERLKQNLARLNLTADTVTADVTEWQSEPFDAVLLDAPCSATGTIRRHPDIPWLKRESDIATLAALQRRLLARAVELTRPGGLIVYCTCSLEPDEGVAPVTELLASDSRVRRRPVVASELPGGARFLDAAGDLRTLPCQLPDSRPQMSGLDGFYGCRIERV